MSDKKPTATVTESGKLEAPFFAAVRERGMLNAMLEIPAKQYEKDNPGMKCRWEYSPPGGDNTMVIAREAMGFKVVDAGEISGTDSSQTSGPVRRGDLVLMAGPEELLQAIADEDARRAEDDRQLPEVTFRQNLEGTRVRRQDGEIDQARPIGTVRQTAEIIKAPTESGGGE